MTFNDLDSTLGRLRQQWTEGYITDKEFIGDSIEATVRWVQTVILEGCDKGPQANNANDLHGATT